MLSKKYMVMLMNGVVNSARKEGQPHHTRESTGRGTVRLFLTTFALWKLRLTLSQTPMFQVHVSSSLLSQTDLKEKPKPEGRRQNHIISMENVVLVLIVEICSNSWFSI